jgi:hypothetical protein
MIRRRSLLVFAVIAGVSVPCAPAAGQDGIFVDPESAPGKEYALPLDGARRQTAGGAESRGEQGAAPVAADRPPPPPPAFGVGVESGRVHAAPPRRERKTGPTRGSGARKPALGRLPIPDRRVAVEGDGSGVALSAAIALGVMLAGLAVAAGARRLHLRGA